MPERVLVLNQMLNLSIFQCPITSGSFIEVYFSGTKLAPPYLIHKKECFWDIKVMLVIPTFVSCFKGSTCLLKGETSPEPWWVDGSLKVVFATYFQVKSSSQSVVHFPSFFLSGDSLIEIQCMYHAFTHLKYAVYTPVYLELRSHSHSQFQNFVI